MDMAAKSLKVRVETGYRAAYQRIILQGHDIACVQNNPMNCERCWVPDNYSNNAKEVKFYILEDRENIEYRTDPVKP